LADSAREKRIVNKKCKVVQNAKHWWSMVWL